MNAIFKRASVRKFTDKPLTKRQIEKLMQAAMAAPSAGNQQPWEFYLVENPELREKLSKASMFAKPAANAPMVIVPCVRMGRLRFPECAEQDMSACIENILLEAADSGLGAVWMSIAPDPERVAVVSRALGLTEHVRPFALIAVGRPADEVEPKGAERYDESRVHIIK